MQLLIGSLERFPRATNDVEIVERKGLGHPDTVCDALAEELSVALCRYYLEHFGLVLHHNVDKVLLWGGVSRPEFGGGEILDPMELFLAGRASASFDGIEVPVAEIAESVCHDWFRKHFHALDSAVHVEIHPLIRSGSSELVDLFMQQKKTGVWLANDTSFGVGFAPTSTLERLTMEIENKLNSDAVKTAYPQIGQDVKVMSVRRDGYIDITVAAREMAAALVEELPEVVGAQCALVSQIGRPVDDPQTVAVRVSTENRSPEEIAPQIRGCVGAQVAAITTLWDRIIRQEVPLY